MKILNTAEMQRIDCLSTERYGVPSLRLMENAGRSVAEFASEHYAPLEKQRIAIVCGGGNNGGDGLVAARVLREWGLRPRVLLFAEPENVKGDAAANLRRLEASPEIVATADCWRKIYPSLKETTLLIDALLGTGLTRPLEGFLLEVVRDLNRLGPRPKVLAVDLPSGMSADSATLIGDCIRANASVTFTAPKIAHVFPPASEHVGKWVVRQIGTPREALQSDPSLNLNLTMAEDLAWLGEPRRPGAHKGNFGHVLVIAGSVGKTGAAAMAARSALRGGAGLVTVATPSSALPIVAGLGIEFMTEPLEETEAGTISRRALDSIDRILEGKSLVALGPGIGTMPETVEFVRELARRVTVPMVIDADGLNSIAGDLGSLEAAGRVRVITPHPGEMARLAGCSTPEIQSHRLEVARSFASEHSVHVVLKGYRTLTAAPDGTVWVNPTGNPGMAKGGTGDVLTGLVAGFLAQFHDRPVTEVVAAAVYIHGLAGDLAAQEFGEISMIAGDLLDKIPAVIKTFAQARAG